MTDLRHDGTTATPGRKSAAGRRPLTSRAQISTIAIDLFTERGFDETSVDDIAEAAGIARRTLFRYYPSKNAVPWGDFDGHLAQMRELLARIPSDLSIADALEAPAYRPLMLALAREVLAQAPATPEPFDGFDPADLEGSLDRLVAFNRASAKSRTGVYRDLAVRQALDQQL